MHVVIPNDWNGAFDASPDVARLRARAEVSVYRAPPSSLQELADQLRLADVVVGIRERTRFPADLLAQLPQLKLIAQVGGQETPHVDVAEATRRGVLISFSGGAPRPFDPVVELTIGMLIALFSQLQVQDRTMRDGGWPLFERRSLGGKALGIVGLGRLGGRVAQMAQAFGMHVLAAGLTLTPERAAAAGAEFRSLPDLFSEADAVSIHLKLADKTRGLIGADLLGRMKSQAFLINTARGPIVDERALVDALQNRRIAGAALDVYDQEPLPPDHPLRSCENALLLGHCGWAADTSYTDLIPRTVAVIEAFLDGAPVNVANPRGTPA